MQPLLLFKLHITFCKTLLSGPLSLPLFLSFSLIYVLVLEWSLQYSSRLFFCLDKNMNIQLLSCYLPNLFTMSLYMYMSLSKGYMQAPFSLASYLSLALVSLVDLTALQYISLIKSSWSTFSPPSLPCCLFREASRYCAFTLPCSEDLRYNSDAFW